MRGRAGALAGLRVIDITRVWAGPHVGRTLADLGADVIKVERSHLPGRMRSAFLAGNDASGEYWNRSVYFLARNAGKREITLDYAEEQGREVLHRLLGEADVLLENFTPPVLRRYSLDYASLKERHPHLVMVSVCGYGQYGPRTDDPALGQTIEPGSGISAVTGYKGEPPILAGNTLGDAISGMHAAAGLLTALIARERNGRGQHVDVAMQEVMIQMSGPQLMDALLNGREHAPNGNRRPGQVRGAYRCEGDDAWVAISARDERGWEALCAAIGSPGLARDWRFRDAAGRDASHDAIDAILEQWTSARTKFEAMATLQAAGVPAGAVLHADEVFANEQLAARRFFAPIEIPDFGDTPLQRYVPALFDGEPYPPRGRAAVADEHTETVLIEAGLSAKERRRLFDAGITAPDFGEFTTDAVRAARVMDLEAYLEQGSLLRIDEDYRERLAAALRASSPESGSPGARGGPSDCAITPPSSSGARSASPRPSSSPSTSRVCSPSSGAVTIGTLALRHPRRPAHEAQRAGLRVLRLLHEAARHQMRIVMQLEGVEGGAGRHVSVAEDAASPRAWCAGWSTS